MIHHTHNLIKCRTAKWDMDMDHLAYILIYLFIFIYLDVWKEHPASWNGLSKWWTHPSRDIYSRTATRHSSRSIIRLRALSPLPRSVKPADEVGAPLMMKSSSREIQTGKTKKRNRPDWWICQIQTKPPWKKELRCECFGGHTDKTVIECKEGPNH